MFYQNRSAAPEGKTLRAENLRTIVAARV